jgi:NAD(P) transhydrogenase subunit alpha
MIVAVPRETRPGERRVAVIPDGVTRLAKAGVTVRVESGAGKSAGFLDSAYESAGAQIAADTKSLYDGATIVVRVARPDASELAALPKGAVVIGFLSPLGDPAYVQALADAGVTALSMESIPRTTRAQAMDALSSQFNIAGYKAVLLAATTLPKFFPMLTTAAGTVRPARVLVLGAGVAGLQAIATARRLGAIVSAYDTRAVVKEQVQSLGAEFLNLDLGEDSQGAGGYAKALSEEAIEKQRAFMVKHIGNSDAVITTAAVPGRKAPVLITAEAVRAMAPGSVIVDLAAETGGNCELTTPGEVTVEEGVTLIGTTNLAATVPTHASQLYTRNIASLLALLIDKDNALKLDFEDDIIAACTLTHAGEILHKPTLDALGLNKGEAK